MRLPLDKLQAAFYFIFRSARVSCLLFLHSPSIPDAINDLDLDDIDLSDEPPAKVSSATAN